MENPVYQIDSIRTVSSFFGLLDCCPTKAKVYYYSLEMQAVWAKFWKNKDGKLTIWQTPNATLIGWALCYILLQVVKSGKLYEVLTFLKPALLFTWAYLELVSGTSYFRRLLGAVVLSAFIAARLV